jgi:hypothetical protein
MVDTTRDTHTDVVAIARKARIEGTAIGMCPATFDAPTVGANEVDWAFQRSRRFRTRDKVGRRRGIFVLFLPFALAFVLLFPALGGREIKRGSTERSDQETRYQGAASGGGMGQESVEPVTIHSKELLRGWTYAKSMPLVPALVDDAYCHVR